MKTSFIDRLIGRLDKLDPRSLQAQFLYLAREKGLLETIFQSIQEGVIVLDGAGRITYANRAAEQLAGLNLESAKGRALSRYFRDIDWAGMMDLDEKEWPRLISREIEVNYPEHRFLSFYVVPLASAPGADNKGAVVMLRDVTRDRLHEATLMESERLNAVKLLAAGVAHEIGNPLNALHIHMQLLDREVKGLKTKDRKNLRALVDVAMTEVARLDMIIIRFLRAIRPSKPRLAPSQVENVLKETLSLLKQEIENRKIRVEVECPDILPKIRVDRNQMKQAFFNVIKNAIQAMPDGGKLVISFSLSERVLEIAFRDTGVGIPSGDLGRIFEPYHTTKPDGTGLGLMIVHRIVQDHGGQIEVSSEPDRGTSFKIQLPLAERRMRLLKAHREGDGQPAEERA